jgi:signal transduction histidine kinase
VIGDRVLLSRAVQNLIVNAREASAPGAAIELRLSVEGERACVDVLDRGPGLPEGPVERLFDPYVSTKNRGSGLGLSLVRDVAQAHGGGITLENREGGGARARFWVPLASARARESATE